MKKTGTLLLVLTVGLLMFLMTACMDRSNSPFIGTWHLGVDKAALPSMSEEETSYMEMEMSKVSFDLTVNTDGTATASGSMIRSASDKEATAKWRESGDTLTLLDPSGRSSSKDMVLTLRNGRLYFDEAVMGEQAAYFYLEKEY